MPSRPAAPISRSAVQRDSLLMLSRAITCSREGGVLSDALDTIVGGIGCTRGAAYRLAGNDLELVADRGVPHELRQKIERLSLDDPWFLAQRAAKSRRTVVETDLTSVNADRIQRWVLTGSGWAAAVAVPFIAGRQVLGALVVSDTAHDVFDNDALAFIETAANIVAIALVHDHDDEDRHDGSRIMRTAQMAALGMLSASFANDLGAPLGALMLELKEQEKLVADMRRGAALPARELEQLAELTSESVASVHRARQITARLLAAVQETKPETVDLRLLAADALALVESSLAQRNIQVDAELGEGCFISGRREELSQLIVVLLLNAADACEARRANTADRAVPGRVRLVVRCEGGRVLCTVEDSGVGVSAHLRARIFDPFFTTKRNAIGLGLTMAKQTVTAHRGHIELTGSALGGADFRVVLPAIAKPDIPSSSSLPPPASPRRYDTTALPILWIDDDDLFLRSMKRSLKEWDIRTARSASEAAAELAHAAPAIVFCDVALPDRLGIELHREVAARDPMLARRFVFVTGGVVTPEMADYLMASGCPTLLKPVDIEEIRKLLEGKRDQAPGSSHTLRESVRPASNPAPSQRAITLETAPRAPASRRDVETRPEMAAVRPKPGV